MMIEETTRSAHATGVNANGLPVDPSIQPLSVYERQLVERSAQTDPAEAVVEMKLKRIATVAGGGLALVGLAQPYAFIPTRRTAISGKFRKREARGWHFLDRFFAGEREWHESRDEDVWQAALEAAQDAGYGSPRDAQLGDNRVFEGGDIGPLPAPFTKGLWALSRLVALALIHRRGGVHVSVASLPTV